MTIKVDFKTLYVLCQNVDINDYPMNGTIDGTSKYNIRCEELCVMNGWTLEEYDTELLKFVTKLNDDTDKFNEYMKQKYPDTE